MFGKHNPKAGDTAKETPSIQPAQKIDIGLKAENLLLEEFKLMGTTASQINDEISHSFNLYLIIVGLLSSGLGTLAVLYPNQKIDTGIPNYTQFGVSGDILVQAYDLAILGIIILLFAAFLSYLFFSRVLNLRNRQKECLLTMGEIEGIYIQNLDNQLPEMKKFLEERRNNIPSLRRRGSAIHLICPTIAFIGSICIAGALELFFLIAKFPKSFYVEVSFLGGSLKIFQAIIVFGFPILFLIGFRYLFKKSIK